ncbi:hypothetical protein EVAR_68305_1 [Eumeta japonica]|uniref:CCHC-type domain-containing protein n=1 Tax=Eumeta variegata TaxID=151549 RepID=A0A4C1STX6_EUMVA|nr:hypothetical protein EVAR_68305_1 [Eumeta japonica]
MNGVQQVICFRCNKQGHFARNCPNNYTPNNVSNYNPADVTGNNEIRTSCIWQKTSKRAEYNNNEQNNRLDHKTVGRKTYSKKINIVSDPRTEEQPTFKHEISVHANNQTELLRKEANSIKTQKAEVGKRKYETSNTSSNYDNLSSGLLTKFANKKINKSTEDNRQNERSNTHKEVGAKTSREKIGFNISSMYVDSEAEASTIITHASYHEIPPQKRQVVHKTRNKI